MQNTTIIKVKFDGSDISKTVENASINHYNAGYRLAGTFVLGDELILIFQLKD